MTEPWTAADGGADVKRHAPATVRNRDAITEVLREVLPTSGTVLEIASGSGEHVVHFAQVFQDLIWLPSDPDPDALHSIAAWSREAGLPNILPPIALDAATSDWPVARADAIVCINMIHISPWTATIGLMRGVGQLLGRDAPFYVYGPFVQQGVETAAGNITFDANLRARDPTWGLRDVEAVAQVGAGEGLVLEQIITMPANNLSLIFRRN